MSYAELTKEEQQRVDKYIVDQQKFISTYKRSGEVRKSLKVANKEGSQKKAWMSLRAAVKRCCLESPFAEEMLNNPKRPLEDLDPLEEIELVERISALPELKSLTSEPELYSRWLVVNHGVLSRNLNEADDFLLESWSSNDDRETTQQPPSTLTPTTYTGSSQEKMIKGTCTEENEGVNVNHTSPSRSTGEKSSIFYDPVRDQLKI